MVRKREPARYILSSDASLRDAMERLNSVGENHAVLFVVDNSKRLVGTMTDGDLRRGLLNSIGLNEKVVAVMNSEFKFLMRSSPSPEHFQECKNLGYSFIPVLNDDKTIYRIVDLSNVRSILPVEAVIMAGGEGQRLRPLTERIPKPMLRVGGKPILEHNVDQLLRYGITSITVSIRYLGDLIVDYFGDGSSKDVDLRYIRETQSLGTFGALGLIDTFYYDAILVMNSDLLTNIDFADFYKTFKETDADMLVAAVPYNVNVPYAVLETTNNRIHRFIEKPTYTFHSNAGIYLIKTSLISRINGKSRCDATDFMQSLIEEGKCVMKYPLVHYWLDIGKHEDFQKAQSDVKHIQF